ncbi:DedA family protein [Streptomyces sp. NPDC057217]|uniref:DedA family protein n=1 Tax=Streptomyces sp. NPDC057217 TaxID=3346054 RepID=UPI003634BF81
MAAVEWDRRQRNGGLDIWGSSSLDGGPACRRAVAGARGQVPLVLRFGRRQDWAAAVVVLKPVSVGACHPEAVRLRPRAVLDGNDQSGRRSAHQVVEEHIARFRGHVRLTAPALRLRTAVQGAVITAPELQCPVSRHDAQVARFRDHLGGQVTAPAAYAILAAAVLAESVLLLGAFIPTLTLLLAAGALACTGELNLVLVIITAASAVVAGDALGHRTGHLLGSRLRTGRLGRRIPAAWQRAHALVARRGGQSVLLSRFVPVVRTLTPHLAGATGLYYRRIAPCSLLAAPLRAGVEATAGYAAATSFQHAITYGGPALAAAAAVIAAIALAAHRIRRSRSRAADSESPAAAPASCSRPPLFPLFDSGVPPPHYVSERSHALEE